MNTPPQSARVTRREHSMRPDDFDAAGLLRPAALARALQHVATEASDEAGFELDWYIDNHRSWVVRRAQVSIDAPIAAPCRLRTETWVEDIRRVRSLRRTQVSFPGGAASACVDWVFVDTRSGRPASIPAEMIAGFNPCHDAGAREAFASGDTGTIDCEVRHRVEHRDIDERLHANNSTALEYFGDAFAHLLAERGWSFAAMRDLGGGLACSAYDIEYRGEAGFGTELRSSVTLTGCDADTISLRGAVCRADDDRELYRATLCWRWTPAPPAAFDALPEALVASLRG